MNVQLLIRNLLLLISSVIQQLMSCYFVRFLVFFYSGTQSVDQSMNLFLISNVNVEVLPLCTAKKIFLP